MSDVCASLSLYTTAGAYVSVLYYTNTAGDIIGIKSNITMMPGYQQLFRSP